MATFRLIAGLGNPGREYLATRHNVGFMIIDRLAEKLQAPLSHEAKWPAEVARQAGTVLCKPQTFMNQSGVALGGLAAFFKIEPHEVLVIVDDVALPLGRLRFRKSGSDGGHNGLKSIISHLGTQEVPRLKVGIGGADGRTLVHHVLGRFDKEEQPVLEETLTRAVEAVQFSQAQGLDAAMNQYNQ